MAGKTKQPWWANAPDEELLDVRLCDLGLRLAGSPLEDRVLQLYQELAERGIAFRPHCWFAEEFFSPDGVPGIALPFYLAHLRLARLERSQMLEAEGAPRAECLRILRHEAGHALDTAYRLHRRKSWRDAFGNYSQRYPRFYHPQPYSKSFVLHLDQWYAQSHPAEDFAETFAVWLRPRSRWRRQYAGWPAIKKIEYVDELMADIRGQKPLLNSRAQIESVRDLKKTLREHYESKRAYYGVDLPQFHDRELQRLFSNSPKHRRRPTASSFLRRNRTSIRKRLARWTGQYQYVIDQVLNDVITRCQQLKLRLDRSEAETRRDASVMLAVQVMNYLHAGHHRVVL